MGDTSDLCADLELGLLAQDRFHPFRLLLEFDKVQAAPDRLEIRSTIALFGGTRIIVSSWPPPSEHW
jgi:hypothetical protein